MASNPNDNPLALGNWNLDIALDPEKAAAINREPIDITKDQVRQLYQILYPFIAADFVHRTDNAELHTKILEEVTEKINNYNTGISTWITSFLNTHTHIGNMGAPTSPPTAIKKIEDPEKMEPYEAQPEDGNYSKGEGHIISAQSLDGLNINHRDTDENVNINTSHNIAEQLIGGLSIILPFDSEEDQSSIVSNEDFANTL